MIEYMISGIEDIAGTHGNGLSGIKYRTYIFCFYLKSKCILTDSRINRFLLAFSFPNPFNTLNIDRSK